MVKTKEEQQAIEDKVKLIHDGVITDSARETAERMGVSIERYMSWGVSSRGEYELGLWTYYINSRTPEQLVEIKNKMRINRKKYKENNKEKVAEKEKRYRERHKEEISERNKEYREEHRERIMEQRKEYREKNKEKLSEKHVCELCGGRYTTGKRSEHYRTKKHMKAMSVPTPDVIETLTDSIPNSQALP